MKIIDPSFEILNISGGLELLELAGRTCYKSEEKITESSAPGFVRGIIKRNHETILEHGSMTVRFVCSRGVSHELVRHRLSSFSQESQRYVNYSGEGLEVIRPLWVTPQMLGDARVALLRGALGSGEVYWVQSMLQAEEAYLSLTDLGVRPEEAREVLPNSTKTEVVMTANFREFRHVFSLRALGSTGRPHPEMLRLMLPLLREVSSKIPVVFDDLSEIAKEWCGYEETLQ